MQFDIDGMPVYFPYEFIYPEQYEYMRSMKRALDAPGPVCLEMPTGTGKTVSLLSLITSYQVWLDKPAAKFIYCCRTVGEVTKTLEELRGVLNYRDTQRGVHPNTLAIALSSRKNMCIHPDLEDIETRTEVDAACRGMTAPWKRTQEDAQKCDYFEKFEAKGKDMELVGVYNLEDILDLGREYNMCPYFLARHAITAANIIVYSYQYVLNPKIAGIISKEFDENSIIVFDEAHNIDDVCIDALSIELDQRSIHSASNNIISLQRKLRRSKLVDADRLQREYQRLINGINPDNDDPDNENEEEPQQVNRVVRADPLLPEDIIQQALPKEILKGEEFLESVKTFLDFIVTKVRLGRFLSYTPPALLQYVLDDTRLEPNTLRFYARRLNSLLQTLEITEINRYEPIGNLCDFASMLATYAEGFVIIIEPYDERTPDIPDPILQYSCLDAAIAMKPVIKKFKRLVITSGTLSPLDMLPRILGFQPVISKALTTTLYRQNVKPLIVSRGSDQTQISTRYKDREDMDIIRNYGLLLLQMSEVIPDGIVAFFVSYSYMEVAVSVWNEMGIINQILKNKLLFVETTNFSETSIALDNYKKSCDSGRGAVFLSVARGKVSEGIDFANHYGRCVILFGIPYVYTESKILKARLEFLKNNYGIREGDFLTFDAMRQASQCVGRVIRGKSDYGIMIFADCRYNRADKRAKLPPWITQFISTAHMDLSTEGAVSLSGEFLRTMAQPLKREVQIGISLWSLSDVLLRIEQQHNEEDTLPTIQSINEKISQNSVDNNQKTITKDSSTPMEVEDDTVKLNNGIKHVLNVVQRKPNWRR